MFTLPILPEKMPCYHHSSPTTMGQMPQRGLFTVFISNLASIQPHNSKKHQQIKNKPYFVCCVGNRLYFILHNIWFQVILFLVRKLQVNSYSSKVYWGIGIFPSHLFSHFLLRKLIEDILLKYYHWGMSNWLDKKLDMGKKENTPQTADTMLVGIWLFICASLWQLKHPRNNQTAIPACKLCCTGL